MFYIKHETREDVRVVRRHIKDLQLAVVQASKLTKKQGGAAFIFREGTCQYPEAISQHGEFALCKRP